MIEGMIYYNSKIIVTKKYYLLSKSVYFDDLFILKWYIILFWCMFTKTKYKYYHTTIWFDRYHFLFPGCIRYALNLDIFFGLSSTIYWY